MKWPYQSKIVTLNSIIERKLLNLLKLEIEDNLLLVSNKHHIFDGKHELNGLTLDLILPLVEHLEIILILAKVECLHQ